MKVDPVAAYRRVVVDTNVFLSAALNPMGVPTAVVDRFLQSGALVLSTETYAELETRIWKPKFDRYLSLELRTRLLRDLCAAAQWVVVPDHIAARRFSRDPSDDAFVRAALAAGSLRLVSGDDDLLCLDPIDDLRIVTPRQAIEEMLRA